jgi:hypothetical protein
VGMCKIYKLHVDLGNFSGGNRNIDICNIIIVSKQFYYFSTLYFKRPR